MNMLNVADLRQVCGGLIGGGYTRSGVPLADASATREPGQNSYGETVPGGIEFYNGVVGMADSQRAMGAALATQSAVCYGGENSVACLIATINAMRAIDATVVPTPYIKGPQGK